MYDMNANSYSNSYFLLDTDVTDFPNYHRQPGMQGLAVLMASASVVLKHETSTLRQSHSFISINLKFGVSDYVKKITSPVKFGSDPISGRDVT